MIAERQNATRTSWPPPSRVEPSKVSGFRVGMMECSVVVVKGLGCVDGWFEFVEMEAAV